MNGQNDGSDEAQVSSQNTAGEFSQGFHLGCGAHALAIILILLLTLFSNKFFWGLGIIGIGQLLYLLPAHWVMKNLALSRHVLRGFWATAIAILILDILGWVTLFIWS